MAFEVYSPYGGQGGSAWKTARIEGAVQMFGLEREILVLPFLPQDLKRGFCGRAGASKMDVQEALYGKVDNLRMMIQNFPKTVQEHIADAAGHAYLAFEEILRMRAIMGL
jgi:Holliday junction resolvasome RuvABC endonuclease subunit